MKVKGNKFVLSETEIKGQIKDFLRRILRVYFWHNLQGLGCFKGLPDLEGVHLGKHFYVEVKSARGKLSKYQETFKEMVEEEGEKVFVVKSVEQFEREWAEWREKIEEER